jgi:GGDEF domain-containing protein
VKVAEKLIKVLEPAFKVGDNSLKSACSIGIAVYPEHGEDVAALCKSADVAMYASKRRKIGYSVYRPENEK